MIGGFTTYSTFILEIDRLAREGALATAVGYTALSVGLGLVAAGTGIATAIRIARHSRPAGSAGSAGPAR